MTAFDVFKWIYVAAIFGASVQTAIGAPAMFMRVVGAIEALVVLMLLFAPSRMIGLALLLLIFAVAVVHEGVSNGIPFRFAIYAAGAWLIALAPEATPPAFPPAV